MQTPCLSDQSLSPYEPSLFDSADHVRIVSSSLLVPRIFPASEMLSLNDIFILKGLRTLFSNEYKLHALPTRLLQGSREVFPPPQLQNTMEADTTGLYKHPFLVRFLGLNCKILKS